MVHSNGDLEWFVNNKLHREDGPAVEHYDGTKYWYQNGVKHRLDGPAIEHCSGSNWWYMHGKDITPKVDAWLEEQNIKLPLDEQSLALFLLTFNLGAPKS